MKTKKIFLILFFISTFVACCKPEEQEPDYREKWVGSYECEESYSVYSYTPGSNGTTSYFYYQVVVKVTMKEDSLLVFTENRNQEDYDAKVNINGRFSYPGNLSSGTSGNFIADSLHLYIGHDRTQGRSAHSAYEGKKIKN